MATYECVRMWYVGVMQHVQNVTNHLTNDNINIDDETDCSSI